MKKQIEICAILCCIVTFTVLGKAKPDNRPAFAIPFDFRVKNQNFPAGKYLVKRLNTANPNLVILKQLGGTAKVLLLVKPASRSTEESRFKLSFKTIDNRNVLIGIFAIDEQSGYSPNETGRAPQIDGIALCFVLDPELTGAI